MMSVPLILKSSNVTNIHRLLPECETSASYCPPKRCRAWHSVYLVSFLSIATDLNTKSMRSLKDHMLFFSFCQIRCQIVLNFLLIARSLIVVILQSMPGMFKDKNIMRHTMLRQRFP